MNDSTAPGTLASLATSPSLPSDLDLDAALGAWVAALTGLPGSLVRPRWQPVPPPQPPQGTNWAAVGVASITPDANAFLSVSPPAPGSATMLRHEDIEAMASFYGVNASGNAALLRDLAQVGQNRDVLTEAGLALVDTGPIRNVPEQVNQVWVRRADMTLMFRRQVVVLLPIRALVAAEVAPTAEFGP